MARQQASHQGIHYLGVRHHGPGSAKRLLAALDSIKPELVLIEGPADCSELLPMLAQAEMRPPVALLAYSADNPAHTLYYPFAEYSPEYQACLWAVRHQVDVRFIDLPVSVQLAEMQLSLQQVLQEQISQEQASQEQSSQEPLAEQDSSEKPLPTDAPESDTIVEGSSQLPSDDAEKDSPKNSDGAGDAETDCDADLLWRSDPVQALATLAGYEDGEAWWNDFIEQNHDDSHEVFASVTEAMTALREKADEVSQTPLRELQREAHMRLEIAKGRKDCEGDVVVVAGAWHIPAFEQKHTAKDDRAQLKTLPKKLAASKVKTTWIPWTSPRLAAASGYGAGVQSPMWYLHLWQHSDAQSLERWLGQVTGVLRRNGQVVSTASVIEAVRLSQSLAVVRNRPAPGFEEIREAVVACLCFGERLLWDQIAAEVLLGNEVGEIPGNAPLVPLLEDLKRLQKKYKLKPEALEKELSLDLRSDAGLGKSILLHRLQVLHVPWGQQTDSGRSRGTFRERWTVSWLPEYGVTLVENLIYGSTIEQAANQRLTEALQQETHLGRLAETLQLALQAQLNQATEAGLRRFDDRAAHTTHALELIDSLGPLIDIQRYGTARKLSFAHIESLVERLAVQAALALPYACRNLNDEEAEHYSRSIEKTHRALQLAELDDSITEQWWQALQTVVDSTQSSFQLMGLCARLLYQAERMSEDSLQMLLYKTLSPALSAPDAARFFEGFFVGAVERLLYDTLLLNAVENWLLQLEEDTFIEYLPLFRRVFSDLDIAERKRLIDLILNGRSKVQHQRQIQTDNLSHWPEHLERLGKLIRKEKTWLA